MRITLFTATAVVAGVAAAQEPSVERGLAVSILGACHDCHTAGYSESEGSIEPEAALKGSKLGFQGPWGTNYATNLRITVATLHEDGFVRYMKVLRTDPPMPWYNLRLMPESDVRSLYRYIGSLGEPGEQAPTAAGPGEQPKTPFIVLAPPQVPTCTRDLDCDVGQVCGSGSVRQCVARP